MRIILLVFFLFTISFAANAQQCSVTATMNPSTAIAVCGTTVFTQSVSATCTGQNIANTGLCSGDVVTSSRSQWYKLHCYVDGSLGFLITPSNGSDDYDWELF
jgi:hypothetical protein